MSFGVNWKLYFQEIKSIQQAGGKVDGIGVQGHFYSVHPVRFPA